jgi:signal transduction histidine kinase
VAAAQPRLGGTARVTEPDPARPTGRSKLRRLAQRLPFPRGLSARLLLLTALFVTLAELLILGPALATYEEGWLADRVRAAELASLAVEAAPAGVVSDEMAGELLEGAGVVLVAVQTDGIRRLLLAAPRMERAPELVDLRQRNPAAALAGPFRTLGPLGPRMIRVVARPQFRKAEFVEIVVSDAPLRRDLVNYLLGLLGVTAFISIVAGVLIYLTLTYFLVRPIRKITESMERFAANPEDPARLPLSGRRDEIGRAEAELARMQDELSTALQSKARLAALGEAVAKINHDLRNMLTSAQLASERLADSGDPRVTRALPRLERALDRAVKLAEDVLAYGRSEEPTPDLRPVALGPAAEAAGEDAGLTAAGHPLELALPQGFTVMADPEQLHRILVNLFRNARQAMEMPERPHGAVRVSAEAVEGMAHISVADQGPGVAPRAQERLFQPFATSARKGGAGLGLSIARELARGHGGDLELAHSDHTGAVFELRLPLAG